MDMILYSDFRNALFNLESGWNFYYWFKENVKKLNNLKEFAYSNKQEFIKVGIDLDNIYKQIKAFIDIAMTKETITGNFDEALIMTALEYAKSGKSAVSSRTNQIMNGLISKEEQEKTSIRQYYDVLIDFVMYYLPHKDNPACISAIDKIFEELLPLAERMLKATANAHYNPITYVIQYLKILKKNKDLTTGERILTNYVLTPITDKDQAALDKLTAYFCTKKLK